MERSRSKAERSRNLRYKRPMLASLGWEAISNELYEIQNACADVHWFTDNDDDTLLNAMDGDEDDVWEFKMLFSEVEAKADELSNILYGLDMRDEFDDCTVALIGNRYKILGYDGAEEDYYGLTSYEEELAQTEAGKRLMRHTKAEMISGIGQCFGITLAFMDLRQQYDYLKATMDILRDENTSILKIIKEIDEMYEKAVGDNFHDLYENTKQFNQLVNQLPENLWLI